MAKKRVVIFTTLGIISLCCIVYAQQYEGWEISFKERVAAQEAIERVYYDRRIGTRRPF